VICAFSQTPTIVSHATPFSVTSGPNMVGSIAHLLPDSASEQACSLARVSGELGCPVNIAWVLNM